MNIYLVSETIYELKQVIMAETKSSILIETEGV
jgi:hypothetical protein